MSAKTNNLKLGLFTLFGLGLLATGVLAFGTWSSFEKKSLFETYVPGDVSGLSVGSAVEFRGVRAGKVTHIGFSWDEYKDSQPGCVVVVFEMKDAVFVTPLGSGWRSQLQAAVDRGLRARLKAQGVTGTYIVSLENLDPAEFPVTKFSWTPKHTFIPSAPGLLGDLLVSLQRALHRLDHLDVTALNQMAQTDLKSAGRVLEKVERVDFENLSTNATALLHDFRGSAAKLDTFIDDTDDTVKKMQLEKLARDMDALMGQLSDTINKLEPGLTSVDFDSLN
jgi:phospholipid/cholesterol/gamma-HCH transport system substrate-binding protein